jgi:hypothetical protein
MTDAHPRRRYIKSSRSGGSGGNCVEWAYESDSVLIRDSKNPSGPELTTTHAQWSEFLVAARTGQEHPWIEPQTTGVFVSKDSHRLSFTPAEWSAFRAAISAGECEPTDARRVAQSS